MRIALLTAALLAALTTPAAAQTDDTYAPARAIVADIGRIVTPNGVQETFEVTLGYRLSPTVALLAGVQGYRLEDDFDGDIDVTHGTLGIRVSF